MVAEIYDDTDVVSYIEAHPLLKEELRNIGLIADKDERNRLLESFKLRVSALQQQGANKYEAYTKKPRNWKNIGKKALKVSAVALFVLLGILQFSSLVITPATTDKFVIEVSQVYKAVNQQETTYIALLPPNKLLFRKEAYGQTDNGQFMVEGYLAPHVGGPVYYVTEASNSYYRYLPKAKQVAMIKMKLLATGGLIEESNFDPIATEYKENLIFYDNKLQRRGISYHELAQEDADSIVKRMKLELLLSNYGKDH